MKTVALPPRILQVSLSTAALILICHLGLAGGAQAQTDADRYTPDSTDDSSAHKAHHECHVACNRAHEHAGVEFGVGSPGTGLPGSSVGLVWFLGKHWELNLSYDFAAGSVHGVSAYSADTDYGVAADDVSYKVMQTTIGMRYFVGNSFYIGAKAGQRIYDLSATATAGYLGSGTASGSTTIADQVQVKSWIAGLSVGNQWMFKSGFYINADWIGYEIPLTRTVSSTYQNTNGNQDPNFDQEMKAINDDLGNSLGNHGTFSTSIAVGFAL